MDSEKQDFFVVDTADWLNHLRERLAHKRECRTCLNVFFVALLLYLSAFFLFLADGFLSAYELRWMLWLFFPIALPFLIYCLLRYKYRGE